jgi:hypothetical protein
MRAAKRAITETAIKMSVQAANGAATRKTATEKTVAKKTLAKETVMSDIRIHRTSLGTPVTRCLA